MAVFISVSWTDRYAHARALLDGLAILEGFERINDVEFAALVAHNMEPPRDEPFSKATVHYWGHGRFQPEHDAVIGIANTCGVDPGWLTFGPATTAAPPPGWKETPADAASTARPGPATVQRLRSAMRAIRGPSGTPLPDVPQHGNSGSNRSPKTVGANKPRRTQHRKKP